MLTTNDVKEELSYAYLHAIAAKAELSCQKVDKDRDSIDARVSGAGFTDSSLSVSPRLEVQLKATELLDLNADDSEVPFALPLKNYKDLRAQRTVPAILVVLSLPDDPERWLEASEESLVTRNCALWHDLSGAPETSNTTSKTVHIKRTNLLTPDSLYEIMENVAHTASVTLSGMSIAG
jgi:hypothetical protein